MCACGSGRRLSNDGHSCEDVDECQNKPCVTMCVSTRQEGRLFYKLLVRAVNGLLLVKNGAENLANSVPT